MSDEMQPTPSDDAEMLRQFLAERDVPCPVCGYNLRGSQSPQCSECGARIALRVGSMDFRIAAWIASLLGAALPLGGAMFMTILGLVFGLRDSDAWRVVGIFLPLDLLYGVQMFILLRSRHVLWRKSRLFQWTAFILLLVLNAAAFSLVVVILDLM